ncbi:MAG: GIY-YIG nuclease family protein [Bacteroidia bacterium]
MNKYYTYVLRSEKDGRFYVGMTGNIERRINEHNRGKVFSTKGYLPWKLIKTEEFSSRREAREKEKYLKNGSGKENIKHYWSRSLTE